jgi:uncharacterized protein (TIGR02145 family)
MTRLKRNIIHGIWIVSAFLIIISGCENKSPALEPDYSGRKDTLIDIDGNEYKTVGIGSQIWMAENLKVTRLTDGSQITNITEIKDWRNGLLHKSGYCWYDNDSTENRYIYGGLYNYYAVETGMLCPTGWHVPRRKDWITLANYLGGTKVAGGKLKENSGSYWISPNHCIVTMYDFAALPGGYRKFELGEFFAKGDSGYWWTSSILTVNESQAYVFSMSYDNTYLEEDNRYKNEGLSIRCIRDQAE